MIEVEGVAVVEARHLVKHYRVGAEVQRVLNDVSLHVAKGHFLAVMGPSGSGKSTLLHLLAGLDTPDAGEVAIEGRVLSRLSDDERTLLRRHDIGIVYQFFNLVPVLTASENIALPAVVAGARPASYRARLDEVLDLVGLGDHRDKLPNELSGGQQQRVAIARALFVEPSVLLADEPTGNLDLDTGAEILALFAQAQRDLDQTIVMVTHDPRSAAQADSVVLLRDGEIASRLEVGTKARGAARDDRTHAARPKAVLRWLEQLDGAGPTLEARITTKA